jgi:glycosyltransferase involved in cell wall biosynthesis
MPRVSIVIPVYNGEDHLFGCLASIAAQTFSNWEAVIVNNRSQDRTGEIADSFAQRDPRFRVVHCTEFLSQGDNYNRAVRLSGTEAEYIKIVEADNTLWSECLERMVALADRDPTIGVVGCYWLHGDLLGGNGLPRHSEVVDGNEVRRQHLLTDVYYLGTPTTLLFRAAALSSVTPCFRSDLFFDDIDLCFRVLRDWKFAFVHQVLAFVRDDNAGIFDKFINLDYIPAYRYLLAMAYIVEMFSAEEAERIIHKRKSMYYRRLGRALVRWRPKQYWDFHRNACRAMGYELRYSGLIWPAISAALDIVLNPRATLTRGIRRLNLLLTPGSRKHASAHNSACALENETYGWDA